MYGFLRAHLVKQHRLCSVLGTATTQSKRRGWWCVWRSSVRLDQEAGLGRLCCNDIRLDLLPHNLRPLPLLQPQPLPHLVQHIRIWHLNTPAANTASANPSLPKKHDFPQEIPSKFDASSMLPKDYMDILPSEIKYAFTSQEFKWGTEVRTS